LDEGFFALSTRPKTRSISRLRYLSNSHAEEVETRENRGGWETGGSGWRGQDGGAKTFAVSRKRPTEVLHRNYVNRNRQTPGTTGTRGSQSALTRGSNLPLRLPLRPFTIELETCASRQSSCRDRELTRITRARVCNLFVAFQIIRQIAFFH